MAAPNKVLLYQNQFADIQNIVQFLKANNYHAIITPVVHPQYIREFECEPMKTKHLDISRSDLVLNSTDWTTRVIPKLSEYIDCDSKSDTIRKISEKMLKQEISLAEHLVQGCGGMLIRLNGIDNANLARVASLNTRSALLVEVPMVDPNIIAKNQYRSDVEKPDDNDDSSYSETWHWWNNFRLHSDYNIRLKLTLEMSADVPSKMELFRWLGEPVDIIILPSNIFLMNNSNYPVLSRSHQEVVAAFIKHNVHFAIKANINDPYLQFYSEYVRNLIGKHYPDDPMKGLEDVLEIPLQPLYDNLDCYTYEIFERDPVKYKLYQDAIEAALIDLVPESELETKEVRI